MANSVAPIPRMRTDAIAILSSVRIQSHFSGRIAISESNMPAQLGEDIICPPSGFHASQVLIDAVTGEVKSWYVKCPVTRRNVKGHPFWSRVWVLASIPTG